MAWNDAPDWTLSVTDLNEYVRRSLSADPMLRSVKLRGEISGLKRHSSGHMYFTLKDENARIDVAMFRDKVMNLDFRPADGQQVIAEGSVSLYAAAGKYQFYAERLRLDGQGDLFARFERLKERLMREGGLALIPSSCFGGKNHVRISYCYDDEVLREGMDRLERFILAL